MTSPAGIDFEVRRDDLRQTRFCEAEVPDPGALEGAQTLLRVAKFAFTANNVTYGVVGEALSYWRFFPAPDGWGRIPVWGFGEVVASADGALEPGERLFGYFPMSSHLLIEAGGVTAEGVSDASPHRAELPPVYNHYTRAQRDPIYEAAFEAHQMLLWPLFMTAFVLDDELARSGFRGADRVVLSSASSKTAIGLAHLLSRRDGIEVVGLTSRAHVAFVQGLGCYARVEPYADLERLDSARPTVFVDMAGNGEVLGRIHRRLGGNLRESCLVGVTHWERGQRDPDLPGPVPRFFFAPTTIQERLQDWGGVGLAERFAAAWRPFREGVGAWMRIVPHSGPQAVETVYRETLEGRARPDEGTILSL